MRRFLYMLVAIVVSSIPFEPARAGDNDAKAILDKAIKALGGEAKLTNIKAFSWTANASIKADGQVTDSTHFVTFKGLEQVRRDFRSRAPYRVIINGDQGWYTSGGKYRPMVKQAVDNQKRVNYLQVVPTLLVPLKSDGFKYEAAGEEEVRGKPALILKIIGPDGKDFMLSFDKESFLPVKEVARSIGPAGKEQVEETFFARYKEIGGIQKATVIETRTDRENYGYFDIVEFTVLDRVPPSNFAPPE
jgi:hypothetical protein